MSGHSKWHSIRHKKAATDAKRGKVFTKIIKEITVAARIGGGDPNANPRLRLAVDKAREANMPNDNVDRAIKKGTGELEGVSYEEIVYEGYGPNGVALMFDIVTDNKNRTVAEIRKILSKAGGNLGESGCVSWMFEKKGIILIPKNSTTEDELMEVALDAGADDIQEVDDSFEVSTSVEDFESVKNVLTEKEFNIESSDILRIPTNTVKLDDDKAEKIIKLMEQLEEHDDVQNISANFDTDD